MFKRTKIGASVLVALGGTVAMTAPAFAQTQTVEVTGSRIKRVDSEGAQPVTVYTRADLEASGSTTVAEFIRSAPFSSAGQFRPQGGSSAQAFSGVSLRGLGSNRTLVLVDGRRVAKAPNVGDSADMNSIPMAAVERIEILTDGASAIYGSDAIGGVVNVILRKDFDGLILSYGETKPSVKGGDRQEASAILGMTGEKGRIIVGASKTSRDIIFVRDYPWGAARGASSFSNNFFRGTSDGEGGFFRGPFLGIAGTCNFPDKGFYVTGGRCRYDFNLVAADEAALSTKSVFGRGEYKIAADWTGYLNVSNTQVNSFGRYAPVPDDIIVQPSSPLNTFGSTTPIILAHRFAAAGNRDTGTDGALNDITLGVQGSFQGVDVDMGARRTTSKIVETGRGFVVRSLATEAINNGTYNVTNPFLNTPALLASITTTTGRDSLWAQNDLYANATFDMFKMAGGTSRIYVGVESSKQIYKDIYDSLSEGGQVLGSSGNSAAGQRRVDSLTSEMFFPITKALEGSLAARYERYTDYGGDFSPKVSLKFKALDNLALRATAGKGFRAPSLPDLNQKPSFSADSVIDLRNCLADGSFTAAECATETFQINGLRISNPNLKSEKSTQFSLGLIWDATQNVSFETTYWNTKIKNVISFISAQTIANRDANIAAGQPSRPIPAGLGITRDPTTGAIQQIVSGFANEGELQATGIDLRLDVKHAYETLGKFKHRFQWSELLNWKNDGTELKKTWGLPKSRARMENTWTYGPVEATYALNLIGKNGGDVREFSEPQAPAYVTHDIQLQWTTPIKGAKLTFGAVNAFGKLPALVGSPYDSKPFNYYLYDAYGAQYYVKAEMKF
jgi:iron complex outermembrane recepter protein